MFNARAGLSHRRLTFPRAFILALVFSCLGFVSLGAVTINGQAYASLPDVATRFGMEHSWLSAQKEARISSRWSKLDFSVHKKVFTYNGSRIYLGAPVALHKGNLYVSEIDYTNTLKPLFFAQQFDPKPKLYHIVLDPGHGGNDSGAQNKGLKLKEKNLTMDLAKRVQSRLEKYGYKVTLTRTEDKYIGLSERGAMSNRAKADLFLSLHFNAVDSTKVDGIETFIMTPAGHASTNASTIDRKSYAGNKDAPWSMLAGHYIHAGMVEKSGADDRGLKRARFAVLRDLNSPGVLIEGGFVTHPYEGRNIGSASYRDKLADGIVEGIIQYQKALNRARGIDS